MNDITIDGSKIHNIGNVFRMIGVDLKDVSKNRPWTPDGEDYLVELYLQGLTVEKIAKTVNRTPGSVVGKIYDLGEEGRLSMSMWGSESKNKDKLETGPFKLFIIK